MTANPGRSSPQLPEFTLGQIVEALGGELVGSPAVSIRGVAPLDSAAETQISFLTSSKYRPQLAVTRAGAVVLGPADRDATERPRIVAQNLRRDRSFEVPAEACVVAFTECDQIVTGRGARS